MKILIDCRPFTRNIAGTAVFLKLAIKYWSLEFPEHELVLVSPLKFDVGFKHLKNVRIVVKTISFFGFKIPNFVWFLLYLPILLKHENPDLYFSPSPAIPFFMPKNTKSLVIVHDVVNIEHRETMELKNRIQNMLLFNRAVKTADYIWVNSKYTLRKINDYFPQRKCIHPFVGLSVDDSIFVKKTLSIEDQKTLQSCFGITKRFLLFVGTLEPRKNLSFLVKLMPELINRLGIQLLIVGAKGWKDSSIYELVEKNPLLKENIIFTGYVSENDLVGLYNMAECFVSTSLNEGFGMPQLEAIMCRCPVVCPHNSAMIEVVEGKGLTVKGWDERHWIDVICRVVNSGRDSFYPEIIDLHQYDWRIIIRNLVQRLGVN